MQQEYNKDLSLSTANLLVKHFGYTKQQAEEFLQISVKTGIALDPFLKGEVFEGQYTIEEQEKICAETVAIVKDQFLGKTKAIEKIYTSSAGAPGAGKTFFLETTCNAVNPDSNVIYVDPDRSTLPKISMYKKYCDEQGFKAAYNKWRDASNYIANFMLIKAIKEGLNIIHGTTASSERVINIYQYLKDIGYKIKIKLFFATDQDRVSAIRFREENTGQAQVTQEDIVSKLVPIFSRMHDCYFNYVDDMSIFFQRSGFWLGGQPGLSVAKYSKDTGIVEVLPNNQDFINYLETNMKKILAKKQADSVLERFRLIEKPESFLTQYLATSNHQPLEGQMEVLTDECTEYSGYTTQARLKPKS